MTGKICSEETRMKISLANSGRTPWNKGVTKEDDPRVANICKGRSMPEKSLIMKKLWKDSEFAKKVMHRRIPSYPEQMYMDYCKMVGKDMRYVGDGTLVIDGKNPDFIDSTGKKLIEIWGDFFHKGQNPYDRIKFFEDRGYECQIIWASELKQLFRMAQTSQL